MSIYSILVVALIAMLVSNVSAFAPNNNFARRITRSALEMKSSGKVKFFDVVKGFGFITPADGSPDVFVHQTAIHAQGFRSLAEGESVEYDVVEDKQRGKSSAANVTGPNGAFVQGAPRREGSFNREERY